MIEEQQELNDSVNPLPRVAENRLNRDLPEMQQELLNHRQPLPENLQLPSELRLPETSAMKLNKEILL